MSIAETLHAGCYRLAANVRLIHTEKGGIVALCDYPLRVVPLKPTLARLLSICTEERSCKELAKLLSMSLKRVEALCDSLRWKNLLEAGPITPPTTWPTLSIIIPSYNRSDELERCLRSLFLLEYPHHCLEIIVVDDASTDTTSTILHSLMQEAETHNLQLHSIRHVQRQGVAISRNTGAEAATYELIAYIDSDCVASPTWLTELVPLFQDTRIAAVGGMIRGYERRSLLGRYEDMCSSLHMGTRPQQVRLEGPLTYLPTANFLVRRVIWQQLGGFAPLKQGEDVDFCRRILLSGAHIRYIPQGIVYHDYRTTLKLFLKIRVAYATAEAALLQRHPSERRILVLPPAQATFAGLVLGGLWVLGRGSVCGIERGSLWGMVRSSVCGMARGMTGASPVTTILTNSVASPRSSVYSSDRACPCHAVSQTSVISQRLLSFMLLGSFIAPLTLTLFSASNRYQKVRQQHVPISFVTVFKATLRGNLAYTYHLCRHLTRYYTLPLLLISLLFFPLSILIAIMLCIVISVDYWRLKPSMSWGTYAICAILNDCAYEVGIVQGCIKYKTWKPLVPIIKRRV